MLKPRELSDKYGFASLETAELLALLLRVGNKKASVFSLAKQYAPIFEQLLLHQEPTETFLVKAQSQLPLGRAIAKSLGAAYECALRAAEQAKPDVKKIATPKSLAETYAFLATKKQEHVYGVYLSSRLAIVKDVLLAKGSTDYVLLEPRDVFYYAVRFRCRNIAIIHNHPSGDAAPSKEDVEQTKRLKAGASLLNLSIIDHVIVSARGYYSFKEAGSVL